MSRLCSEGALKEYTYVLFYLSNACICEVDGVPPIGMVGLLSLLSTVVLPVVSSLYSSSAYGFNLCLLRKVWLIGIVEGVTSSQLLFKFFSSLRGVYKIGGFLMICSGWARSSKISGCSDSSYCSESSAYSKVPCCLDGCVLCSCDCFRVEFSPNTCTNESSSNLLSKSTITLSTSTYVLSWSIRVPSTHFDWLPYCSIYGILWSI